MADAGLGLEWPAIWRAGLSSACFLLPVAIVNQWARPSGAVLGLFFITYLFIAGLGGFGAAKLAPGRPLPNGAAAGALGYALVQAIGVIHRLIDGSTKLSPVAYVSLALLMATCGMFGAMLERRTRPLRDSAPTSEEDLP